MTLLPLLTQAAAAAVPLLWVDAARPDEQCVSFPTGRGTAAAMQVEVDGVRTTCTPPSDDGQASLCLRPSGGNWPSTLSADVACAGRRVHVEGVRPVDLRFPLGDGPTSAFFRLAAVEPPGSGDCLSEDGRRWAGVTWSLERSDGRMVFGVFAHPLSVVGRGLCGPEGRRVHVEVVAPAPG